MTKKKKPKIPKKMIPIALWMEGAMLQWNALQLQREQESEDH